MYTIYDYAYNGYLYLNNIMRPRHKRLSAPQAAVATDDLFNDRVSVALQTLQYLAEEGGTSVT